MISVKKPGMISKIAPMAFDILEAKNSSCVISARESFCPLSIIETWNVRNKNTPIKAVKIISIKVSNPPSIEAKNVETITSKKRYKKI